MSKTHRCDVIIPARGESLETLKPTVEAFRATAGIGQIILADDGLGPEVVYVMDNYVDVISKTYGVGKGQAVRNSLMHVQEERVIFCDGDLHGFTEEHAKTLSYPADVMVLGITDYTPKKFVPWDVPSDMWALVTGERAVPTHLVEGLDLHGYCMEVQINRACIKACIPIVPTFLNGCEGTPRWSEKRWQAMQSDGEWLAAHPT